MADRAVIGYHTRTPAIPPMTAQRDPHLPPPEVCDWLLAQEWSKSTDVTVSCVESWSAKSGCQAIAAIGRDEYIDLILPMEALQVLREDAETRREAIESKRRELAPDEMARKTAREQSRAGESEGEKLDPETTLLQRVLADAEQAEISAFSAIGVLTTAATMMVSQCYDLTKLGDDHA